MNPVRAASLAASLRHLYLNSLLLSLGGPGAVQYTNSCSYYEMQHYFHLRVCSKQQNSGDIKLESRGNHVSNGY